MKQNVKDCLSIIGTVIVVAATVAAFVLTLWAAAAVGIKM